MNVLFMLNNMEIGGSEVFTLNLAKKLLQKNHKVIVLSSGGKLVSSLSEIGAKHYWVGAGYISLWLVGVKYPKTLTFLDQLFTLILTPFVLLIAPYSLLLLIHVIKKEKIEVINSMQPGSSLLSAIASRILHIPFVITVHAPRQIEFAGVGLKIGAEPKRVIAISEETNRYLVSKQKVAEENISIFPPIVGLQDINRRLTSLDGYSTSFKQVVFVSGFFHAGAAVQLIEAVPSIVKEFEAVRFTLIGQGSPETERFKKNKSMATNKLLGDAVIKIVGLVENRSILDDYLDSADIVVGTGLSAWEAIARCKPLVVAGVEGFDGILSPETYVNLISHNLSGRYSGKKTTPQNMTESITKLLKNAELIIQINGLCENLLKKYGTNYIRLLERYAQVSDENLKR